MRVLDPFGCLRFDFKEGVRILKIIEKNQPTPLADPVLHENYAKNSEISVKIGA